ncbi:unnamed protein product, partial [Laminaria digitata]
VGDRLKTPEVPVWVVCSESHYSVLFSLDPSLTTPPPADDEGAGEGSDNNIESSPGDSGGGGERGGELEDGEGAGDSGVGARAGGGGVSGRFDLEYYDGLGRQDEVICLTVDQRLGGHGPPPPTAEDEANGALVAPLDLVIRTRWPAATVDWNGLDPIL